LKIIFALCMTRVGAKKNRFEIAIWLRDSRRGELFRRNRTREKSLFHRIICSIGHFDPSQHTIALSSAAVLFLAARAIGFREGFAPLTHNGAVESLFFSLCCSKRNAVQVDSRPH